MKIKSLTFFAILLLIMPVSCVERYWPELGNKYEKALVVDGTISSNPGPYTIRLSQSSSVEYPKIYPYVGCQVSIIEEGGTTEILSEKEPGVYMTSPTGINGEVGKQYKIRINTPDERTYESTYEKLEAAIGLASVYAEYDFKESEDLPYSLEGYQFFLDTEPAVKDSNYFMWSLETTYKYQADYLIRDIYTYRNLSTFPQPDSFYTCWQTEAIPGLFTYETSELSSPVIKRLPLHFVSTEGRELSIRYSLKIVQHTITAAAFNYWNNLQKQNESQGNLYDNQPYQIQGNIQNINNPNEPVMGYFMAAGISEMRVYIDRPSFTFHYWICQLTQADYEAVGELRYSSYSDWPIYLTRDNNGVLALPDERCLDCRKKGGSISKPAFWED